MEARAKRFEQEGVKGRRILVEAKDKDKENWTEYLGSRKKKRNRMKGTPAIARKEEF